MNPNHVNCLCVMPPIAIRFKLPTARQLTLDVMQLQMQRHHTKPWQFIKRFKIQVEIDRTIIVARSLGYFQVKK